VRLAARRLGFRRKANIHPAEAVDDARLAAMGLIAALAQIDHGWARETGDTMAEQAQAVFKISRQEAEEMVIFGRWLSDQSGTRHEIVRRLAKRLNDLAGPEVLADLERMMSAVCQLQGGGYSDQVQEAIATVNRLIR
jgi:hypothetical protein